MRRERRGVGVLALCAILVGAVAASACGWLFPTTIAEIKKNPTFFEGRTVTIKGTVEGVHDLLALKFYTIRDDTDEITVVTQSPLPKEGDTIHVTGKVNQAFAIASHRVLVIEEGPTR